MMFVALVVVMLLLQYWGSGAPLQHDAWFRAWTAWLDRRLAASPLWLRWALQALLPALLVGLLFQLLGGAAWGMPALLLAVIVLLYSLGRGDLQAQVEAYLAHWQQGEWQAAWHRAAGFVASEKLAEVEGPEQLHRFASRAVVYQGFERLFAVVFWFVVLGPAGALLYRLTALARDDDDDNRLDGRVLYWLEWLPARLLVLALGLVGNFSPTVAAVSGRWLDTQVSTADLLDAASTGALQGQPLPVSDEAVFRERAVADIRAQGELLGRSALVWLAVIALLQLF